MQWTCPRGHRVHKVSNCPTCPTCERIVADESELPKIGAPATRALLAVGVRTLADVSRWTANDLLALHGVGPKAVRLLTDHLAAAGLTFAANRRVPRPS